jgi:hypothetical protein
MNTPYLHTHWIMKNILKFSDEDIKQENLRRLREQLEKQREEKLRRLLDE